MVISLLILLVTQNNKRDDLTSIFNLISPLALLLDFLILISYFHMNFSRTAGLLRNLPSFPKLPLVGSLLQGPLKPEDARKVIQNGIKRYGRTFAFWVGNNPYVFVTEAETISKILASPDSTEKGTIYKHVSWVLGKGLITSTGSLWKRDRKLLSPSFKYQKFDGFLDIFNLQAGILMDILEKEFEYGKPLVIHPYLCRSAMDTISGAALGIRTYFQTDVSSQFLQGIDWALESMRTRVAQPYLTLPGIWNLTGIPKKEEAALNAFSDLLDEGLRLRKEALQTDTVNDDTTRPFIDAVLDSKSRSYISGHINTIFAAGFETTASAVNHTLFLLSLHPEIQERVRTELDSIWDDPTSPLGMADLTELRYMDMVIKETLRLFPSVPVMSRQALEDIRLDGATVVPKGTEVLFILPELHRDPKYFPDPERFDPDRFLPELCASREPYAYIPFSIGPRNCIGMKYAMLQMKTMLSYVLKRFKVSTPLKGEEVDIVYGIVVETRPHIQLLLEKRK